MSDSERFIRFWGGMFAAWIVVWGLFETFVPRELWWDQNGYGGVLVGAGVIVGLAVSRP